MHWITRAARRPLPQLSRSPCRSRHRSGWLCSHVDDHDEPTTRDQLHRPSDPSATYRRRAARLR